MIKLLDDRAKGERTRVLFEMLMETVKANYEMKQHEVFDCIKVMVEAEQEAIRQFTEIQQKAIKKPKK